MAMVRRSIHTVEREIDLVQRHCRSWSPPPQIIREREQKMTLDAAVKGTRYRPCVARASAMCFLTLGCCLSRPIEPGG